MKVSKSLFVALCLVVSVSALVAAQSPQFLASYTIQVRPGANAQFEDYLGKIKEAANEVGAPQHWSVFQVAWGGPGNQYGVFLPFDEWGAMDLWESVPSILEKAYGAEEAAKVLRAGGASIAQSETSISTFMGELSYNASSVPRASMFRVRVTKVHRGMQDQYLHFVAKLNEAWEKTGDRRTVVRRRVVIGDIPVFTSARPLEKWSELDENTDVWEVLEKAHGETETRRLQKDLPESIAESQLLVIAHRPDLSRGPSTTSND